VLSVGDNTQLARRLPRGTTTALEHDQQHIQVVVHMRRRAAAGAHLYG
jgi:hypothetical protein